MGILDIFRRRRDDLNDVLVDMNKKLDSIEKTDKEMLRELRDINSAILELKKKLLERKVIKKNSEREVKDESEKSDEEPWFETIT